MHHPQSSNCAPLQLSATILEIFCTQTLHSTIRQVGSTPLILAVCMERWPCADLLLARGGAAALQARDATGWTPLHHALAKLQANDGATNRFNAATAAWVQAAAAAHGALYAAAKTEVASAAAAAGDVALRQFRGARGGVCVGAGGTSVFHTFASVRGDCLCPAGAKGYYELEVLVEPSCPQWGFCSVEWERVDDCIRCEVGDDKEWSGEYIGVGDDKESWGVDGDRVLKWHGGEQGPFGRAWRKGDVIGLACELPPVERDGRGRILVSVNGKFTPPNGAAFHLPPGLAGLHPAFSCASGAVRCNLGGDPARPLRHAPPAADFQPMAAFPPPRAVPPPLPY